MKRWFSTIATLLCVFIAVVLLKLFGATCGFGFMIIVILLLTAGIKVLKILTDREREKLRKFIRQTLDGDTMMNYLQKNPDLLREIKSGSAGDRTAMLEALDPEDARRVKALLDQNSAQS